MHSDPESSKMSELADDSVTIESKSRQMWYFRNIFVKNIECKHNFTKYIWYP